MAQDPFGDIPLFREIQRLLASSGGGPINFEIAGQVATAIAARDGSESPVRADIGSTLRDAVRNAEVLVSGYSRIPLDEPMRSESFGREQWITQTLEGWRWLLEQLATRFTGGMSELGGEEQGAQVQQVMSQIGPLLLGLQTGTLVGSLSVEVLSTYDPPIPRTDDDTIFVVGANVESFATNYDLESAELIRWIALHDVACALISRGVPWVSRFHRSLLIELVNAIEIDSSQLEQRLMELQTGGLDALQQAEGIDRSIPLVETPRHRAALARVRAFVALLEGYSAHVASAVQPELLPDAIRVEESMARYRAAFSDGKSALAGVLGFSADRELEAAGRTFCEAVVKLEGLTRLNVVWEAPDNLPTFGEIRDPFVWIDRVLKQA